MCQICGVMKTVFDFKQIIHSTQGFGVQHAATSLASSVLSMLQLGLLYVLQHGNHVQPAFSCNHVLCSFTGDHYHVRHSALHCYK